MNTGLFFFFKLFYNNKVVDESYNIIYQFNGLDWSLLVKYLEFEDITNIIYHLKACFLICPFISSYFVNNYVFDLFTAGDFCGEHASIKRFRFKVRT